MSLQSVLIDAAVRILGVALEDKAGLSDGSPGRQPNTDLGVMPLVAEVLCQMVPSL